MAKCEPGCTCGRHNRKMTSVTPEQAAFIRENAPTMNINQMRKALGCPYDRVRDFCAQEGIEPASGYEKCEPGCDCWKHSEDLSQKRRDIWKDPEYKQSQIEKYREAWENPERRKRHSKERRGKKRDGTPATGYYIHQGYKVLTGHQEHPLARSDGTLLEHRKVLYEALGPGPQECHWCGKELKWHTEGQKDLVCVDHLNDDGLDNAPENLAPSCSRCNAHRGTLGLAPLEEEQRNVHIEMEGGIKDGTVQGLNRLDGHDGRGGAGLQRRKGGAPETHPHQ